MVGPCHSNPARLHTLTYTYSLITIPLLITMEWDHHAPYFEGINLCKL